jgi:LPXTG-motif cell wall-anchored protein
VADTYNATVLPLVLGFALLGAAGLLVMRWTEAELAPEH